MAKKRPKVIKAEYDQCNVRRITVEFADGVIRTFKVPPKFRVKDLMSVFEHEHGLLLQAEDNERKLLRKIDRAIDRILMGENE